VKNNINNLIWAPTEKDIELEVNWITNKIKKYGTRELQNIARKASEQRKYAYSPYSNYKVGVALLAASGQLYVGNNAERAGYSETNHTEEAVITNATINGEIQR